MTAQDVTKFWRVAGPARWFAKDAAFDAEFSQRFMGLHEAAARGELQDWLHQAESALALLILLDQFPRNCFRGTPRMYATDALARQAANQAIAQGHDLQIEPDLRLFLYLPFSHAEDLAEQERAVSLAIALGPEPLRHAEGHRDIIRRFGRFPHRNAILGRISTAEEQAFLAEGGFAG